MSATIETNPSSWRKRLREDDAISQMDLKKPRTYYYRLASESSKGSEEDTESVCSVQGLETDIVRDTTDTDSKSGGSDQDEYEVHYEEYEVASLSEDENGFSLSNSSSDSEGMMLAAAAAVICDSSIETWITDCEDSDNSSLDGTSFGKTDFSVCIQCKSENDNPLYSYCEKCFQSCRQCKMRKTIKCFPLCIYCYKDRKKLYPPRPRRTRKARKTNATYREPPVQLATLRSCLKDLSQDSGIGSSQEWPVLDLAQIVVPNANLPKGTSKPDTIVRENINSEEKEVSSSLLSDRNTDKLPRESLGSFSSTDSGFARGKKRSLSESSLSDFDIKSKIPKKETPSTETILSDVSSQITQPNSFESDITNGSSFISSISNSSSTVLSITNSSSFVSSITNSNSFVSSIRTNSSLSMSSINSTTESEVLKTGVSDNGELCILCNDAPKDAIFLHTKVAHQCCCYRCAKRTIKTMKRCPICNVTVSKVFRVIKS